MQFRKTIFVLTVLALLLTMSLVSAQDDTFALTIMHTNDVHAAYEPGASGDGGAAIQAAVVSQIRAEGGNSILIDAGDRFTGTLFHQQWRGEDSARIMNAMDYDVMTVGNHEFDDRDETLAAFVESLNFPVITANIDFSGSELLAGKIQPYTVLEVNGQQIGVIGLTPPDTGILSSPGPDLVFSDDLVAPVQAAVDALTAEGVNKIILLSHIGIEADRALIPQITGVDIVVGGHSHTVLSNLFTAGEDSYPVVVEDASGSRVYVVQAGSSLRYLGRLNVVFDADGVVTSASGDLILLSRYITPDAEVQAIVDELAVPIEELKATPVGESSVFLVGDRNVCRVQECNLGNLVTDAMREYAGAQIAIMNAGGIRANVPVGIDTPEDVALTTPTQVTLGDVLTVLPFGNLVSTFELSGADVVAALENGVSRYEDVNGRFPQVSGIRFSWDGSKEAGSRIVSVEVMGENGEYAPIDEAAVYSVVTNNFMRTGGDGYAMFAENGMNAYDAGAPLDVVVADYIRAAGTVAPVVDGRITRVDAAQ